MKDKIISIYKWIERHIFDVLIFIALIFTFLFSLNFIQILLKKINLLNGFFEMIEENLILKLLYTNLVAYIFIFFIPSLIMLKITKTNIKWNVNIKNFFISICLGITLQPIAMVIASIMNSIVGSNNVTNFSLEYKGINPIIFALIIGMLPAFFEEFAFRGFIFNNLKKTNSLIFSAIASSFLFAFAHFNISQFVYAFVLGIFLAYIYNKTQSIINTMIIHFVINSTQGLMIMYVLSQTNNNVNLLENENDINMIKFMPSFIIFGIITLLIFVPLCKKLYNCYTVYKVDIYDNKNNIIEKENENNNDNENEN